jgi:hypothetical protein
VTTVTRVLYPQTFGGWPPCSSCFTQAPDLAGTLTPQGLRLLCGGCARAIADGRPAALPSGDALAEVWQRLARWHINGEIEAELVDAAVAALASRLGPMAAKGALADLGEAMLAVQDSAAPHSRVDAALGVLAGAR